ncbi:putative NADP-dependent oxidoreductase YfmJ [Bosea sp. 62]|uniref:NADP-dependent oxidoreductase n=1 Tax=unclassified Bosea (in: a-proteobacteria) TaxID=2653178 RepID=UPI00125A2014|nr:MULTISPECIES: NADP-dependent oxidoreductase [unclassified Bosea (in: a-proteobacteria)]CAD5257078.1 putative NADP-dependent oxidoreductase YfmJ [Bosea sp. 7B]CAD5273210.1 putative NADP-dependent oxidoreductase YfmJ [Bosea sp. 21B]CAD5284884.1 putative NADP-dependent oxidoreductase YfmJ [Bosea sp. 46]VVT60231.1 putative NADP-dependent oxidoreductase YfmJ [Bosea sp. EC-HK365B]VXB60195.1 putative NADP-dependent oxidoreductase YfmJ [Bosea sp. 62]
MTNRQWRLASHPQGMPTLETWSLHEAPMPEPGPGQILVRTQWLSLDPYMRGRISPSTNYAKGVGIGELMQGGGVGEVVTSNHPDWKPGDIAEAMGFGWQEYAVLTPDLPGAAKSNKVDPALGPPQATLSWLGMPGLTAYIGLFEIGRPKPGDTLVVSAASGAVGQLVGQIGKLCGARVIGIAGSDEKLAWCRSVGFDATLNYKTTNDLTAALAALAPGGIDVFFDNTGGPIHDAVLRNLAVGARVAICGRIALANDFEQEDIGLRASSRLIVTRALVQGFIAFDWWHRRGEAMARLAAWHREGRIQTREDVLDGFERMPEAFLRMMTGRNFGKQLVRLKA